MVGVYYSTSGIDTDEGIFFHLHSELIRVNSSPSTSLVLTALPAPEEGTAEDAEKSLRYLRQLENLFGGGPPVLGVHAKQLTMTSAL